jgi:hypothetical protein
MQLEADKRGDAVGRGDMRKDREWEWHRIMVGAEMGKVCWVDGVGRGYK